MGERDSKGRGSEKVVIGITLIFVVLLLGFYGLFFIETLRRNHAEKATSGQGQEQEVSTQESQEGRVLTGTLEDSDSREDTEANQTETIYLNGPLSDDYKDITPYVRDSASQAASAAREGTSSAAASSHSSSSGSSSAYDAYDQGYEDLYEDDDFDWDRYDEDDDYAEGVDDAWDDYED